MFSDKKEQNGKKNQKKAIIGYDLGRKFSQISYSFPGEDKVATASCIAGTEQYNIPTVLCKRRGVNQWFYGKEALKYAGEEDGILVEDLLTLAERGEEVIVEEESYDPAALLTLFVKRSLSLLNMHFSSQHMEAVMFTVEDLSPRMVEVLSKVAGALQLREDRVFFQSHLESFYCYMQHQPEELWKYDVFIYEYNDYLKSLHLECNRKTTPQVVFITEQEHREMKRLPMTQSKEEIDRMFLAITEEELKGKIVSTIYLLGDGFKDEWALESLRFLCRNRRVFQGNNLYSKGACFGGMERIEPEQVNKKYVYLGKDKLKANIGMRVLRRGTESYFAVMDAGTNWYEVTADFEMILESGNTVDFVITPLTGENVIEKRITLEGLPERPEKTTRLKFHTEMTAVDRMTVTIEDLGFGEIFPSSGKGWTQTISL